MPDPVPSSLVPVETDAADDQVWLLSSLLLSNWTTTVKLRSSWSTDIVSTQPLAESRSGLRGKPRRTLEFAVQGLSISDVRRLRAMQFRAAKSSSLLPLHSDVSFLTQSAPFVFSASSSGDGADTPRDGGPLVIDLTGYSTLAFTGPATLAGIVAITAVGDAPSVEITPPTPNDVTPTAVGRITYSVPGDAVLIAPTTGSLTTTGFYDRWLKNADTADEVKICGGTLDGSTGSADNDAAAAAAAIGLTLVGLPNVAKSSLPPGWIDAEEVARIRFWLLPFGASSAGMALPAPPTLICETVGRRFFKGARVIVAKTNAQTQAASFETATIASVGDGYIALTAALGQPYKAGDRVFPAIECRPILSAEFSTLAGEDGEATFSVEEITGPSALPAWEEPDAAIDGFDTLDDLPILALPFDWQTPPKSGAEREETQADSGITAVATLKGARPVATAEAAFLFVERDDASALMRFFDARRGRLFPFLLPSPATDLKITAVATDSITARADGPELDWSFFTHVAVKLWDGTIHVHEIDSVERADDLDVVALATDLPSLTLSQIHAAATAAVVRFDADELAEEWTTDKTFRASLKVREVFDVESTGLTIDDPTVGGPDPDPSDPTTPDGGGGTTGPPPGDGTYYPGQGCDGLQTSFFVRADPSDFPLYIYDPVSDAPYEILEDAGTTSPTGPILQGWERIPGPPGDPSNPDYASCGGDPGTGEPTGPQDCGILPNGCSLTRTVVVANHDNDPVFNRTWTITFNADLNAWESEYFMGRQVLLDCTGGWTITLRYAGTYGGLFPESFSVTDATRCAPPGAYPPNDGPWTTEVTLI